MQFVEDAAVSGGRKTKDGYLVADVRCARTGIQVYTGAELGRDDLSVVKVYRPESEVFDRASLASFAGKPVTNDHPRESVTADTWKALAVGALGNEIARDGEFVRVPVMLMDAAAIRDVEAGKREVSMGYTMDLAFEAGETPDGEAYDAIMSNLRMNHLAIVARGRAGKECRVGDGAVGWGIAPIHGNDGAHHMPNTRTVIVDGIPVEATDASAGAITKLMDDRKAAETALDAAEAAHAAAIADKDKEIAAKDAEIAELKSKTPTAAAIDGLVTARVKLIGDAKAIAPDVTFDGLSDADVRKAAVTAVHGGARVADKSSAYIEAAFDIAVAQIADKAGDTPAATDPVREALRGRDAKADPKDNGQAGYEKRLTDGWKGGAA